MSQLLKSYLKRLTNLSTRNKSLLLTRLVSEQFADLHEADFLLNVSSFELLHHIIQKRKRVALCDVADPRYDKVNILSRRLRKIARTVDFIEEERGTRSLFVGYPFVRGKFVGGQVVHAPLLFFPVALEIDKGQWCLRIDSEAGPHLNRSFALAYSHFNQTVVPDAFLETDFDEFPTNITIFRTELYKWLRESPFAINFNQELFQDVLQGFDAQRAKELENSEKVGELKLYSEAVLGVFPQTGSYLEEDYHFLLEEEEGFSIQGNRENFGGETAVKEEDLLTPFTLDSSQEQALIKVKQGESLVIQGPPGTGKSQLICNLMADYAARGKKVLLVCQKKAALDVVHERMRAAGLEGFTALIHDHLTDRAPLYRQMALQIEHLEAFRKENYSLDAVSLEREFLRECRLTDRLVAELSEFKNALFDDSVAGLSVKELYLTSSPEGASMPLTNLLKYFPVDKSEEILRAVAQYFTYQLKFGPGHSWLKRRDFSQLNHVDSQRILDLLSGWPGVFAALDQQFRKVFSVSLSRKYLVGADQLKSVLKDVREVVNSQKVLDLFRKYLSAETDNDFRTGRIKQLKDLLEGEEGIDSYLESHRLIDMLKKVEKAISAQNEVISSVFWSWFSKDKEEIRWLSSRHSLTTGEDDLKRLARLLKNRLQFEENLAEERLGFDQRYLAEPIGIARQFARFLDDAKAAADGVDQLLKTEWFDVVAKLTGETKDFADFRGAVDEALYWVTKWESVAEEMDTWFVAEQFNELVAEPETFSKRLGLELEEDFENLVEIDALWAGLSRTEQVLLERLKERGEELSLQTPGEYQKLLDNSLRLAWIEQIERRYPVLRSVSSLKMEQWEEELQRSIARKQALSAEIVRMKLREEVYDDIAKNRLGNTVTYRELFHQLTKKRRIWPIRKIISRFHEDVFRLVPCWMVSPESASVMFPMEKGFFDLVIFDEASQCYAEYALPAAYRGKQLVVAGDSKQLQPTDLYKVRYEEADREDEDLAPGFEAESLLDLAGMRLPSHQLTGHYRSLSLDLIQFSNQHFYGDSLRLLPDFAYANTAEPGILYHKVDGVWKEGTNLVEAEQVLMLLRALKSTGKSVGVVTFNYPQQQLISQLVEDAGLNFQELFVKNIENVQGDERDVIIFSVGYAPDQDDRLKMQFGSLNARSGENRLNVAVTRAREKVHIVTSLLPHQLKVETALYAGPKLLKAYLEYAMTVSEGRFIPKPAADEIGDRASWSLKSRLLGSIPGAYFELPFADITIKSVDRYEALILTDDDQYNRSRSPKEPHAYLPALLEKKGWPFKRVYSRAFWKGKQKG